jgi:hypothetical protein
MTTMRLHTLCLLRADPMAGRTRHLALRPADVSLPRSVRCKGAVPHLTARLCVRMWWESAQPGRLLGFRQGSRDAGGAGYLALQGVDNCKKLSLYASDALAQQATERGDHPSGGWGDAQPVQRVVQVALTRIASCLFSTF